MLRRRTLGREHFDSLAHTGLEIATAGIYHHPMTGARATQIHRVLYDDECPLCTFQMRLLTWLDWFNVIRLMPLSRSTPAEVPAGLTREALLEAIHCVAHNGRIYRGARCIRFLGMRLPLLFPIALVLWLPGVIWLAERIYQWVSRNRHLLSRLFGCKEACSLMPERKRAAELGSVSVKPEA